MKYNITGGIWECDADEIGAGTVTGTGADTQIAFWDDTNSITGSTNFIWDNTSDRLGITGELQVGENTGTDGYDVTFWGDYLGLTGGRMFWDSSKEAFRAGRATSDQWDDANVGGRSFATGYNTTGPKATPVTLSGITPGDDLWVGYGCKSSTSLFQLRAVLPDDIFSGVVTSKILQKLSDWSDGADSSRSATDIPAWIRVVI